MKVKFLLVLVSAFFSVNTIAQVNDTLLNRLQKYDRDKAARGDHSLTLKDTAKVKILHEIVLRDHTSKPDRTLKYIAEQENLSREIGYTWGLANAFEMRGNICDYKRKYEKALANFQEALQLYGSINDFRVIDVSNNMGIVYSKQGIYTESLKYHHKALTLSEKHNDIFGFVSSYNNIGIIYKSLGKNDTALQYYFKCLRLQLSSKERLAISNTYLNIGEIYRVKQQYNIALKYLDKGINAALKDRDTISLANNYSTISAVYAHMKQYKKALATNEKAYILRQKVGDDFGQFTSYNFFGDIYQKLGDNDKALLYAEKSLEHLQGHGELDMYKEAYGQLAEINATKGDFKAAYANHQLYKKYSDSIFNAENQKKLVEQQMNFDFDKKEALANEALKRQKAIRNYTAGGVGAAAFFFIIFLVRRNRQKATQKKKEYEKGLHMLQDELEIKEVETESLKLENENIQLKNRLIAAENDILQEKFDYNKRELASIMLYASRKNEMLAGLRGEIEAMQEGKVSRVQIEKIKAVIHQNLYLDADWDKFKLHFEQVHPDFFAQLKTEHPTLTAYEIRLYTYLHMKLSTKEIAGLLNITPASVIKAKVRLNKKLNQSNDEDPQDA